MTVGRLVLLVCLNLAAAFFARRVGRRIFPQVETATRFTADLIIYLYAIIVGLTFLPKLTLSSAIGLAALLAMVALAIGKGRPLAVESPFGYLPSFRAGFFLFLLALAMLKILAQGLLHPRFFHDPMTYQLTFAAQWLQQAKITLVSTPFGDPSQAYAPSNPSLYYLWLLLPLHTDHFALVGQFPFALLGLAALAGLARLIEVPRPWHLLAPLFLLAAPMFREQSASAYSDLALASTFAAALFFFLRARYREPVPSFLFGAMALGLMLGTKYNSLPLAALVLPVLLFGWLSLKRASSHWLAVTGLSFLLALLAGGYWYGRNYRLTGNPVYPFRVDFFGVTLVTGVYGRAEMQNWIYHAAGYEKWKETLVALADHRLLALYTFTILVLVPWFRLRRRINRLSAYILLLPLVIDRINWHLVPFQVDRFWMPALLLAPLALAALTRKWPRLGYLLFFLALAEITASRVKNSEPVPPAGMTRRESALLAWQFEPAWNALAGQGGNFTVAYAGNNMPYPLYGPRLDRRVRYVNINANAHWRFHDFASALAGPWNTPEPAPYRQWLSPGAWWNNLREEQVAYLIVTRLGEPELINIEHDAKGWPTEKSWAEQFPAGFELVYADPLARIYRLNLSARAPWDDSSETEVRPRDAIQAYRRSRETGERWFPLAETVIKKYHLRDLSPLN